MIPALLSTMLGGPLTDLDLLEKKKNVISTGNRNPDGLARSVDTIPTPNFMVPLVSVL